MLAGRDEVGGEDGDGEDEGDEPSVLEAETFPPAEEAFRFAALAAAFFRVLCVLGLFEAGSAIDG